MSAFREFQLDDLFKLNRIFFDPLVEIYALSFYMQRLLQYPHLSVTALTVNNRLSGYIFGSHETNKSSSCPHNAHISSLAIDQTYRRLGVATKLIDNFHQTAELNQDWYVDLFVRDTNKSAIKLYESFGYVKYRWLPKFYNNYHAYDMRLPLKTDVTLQSLKGMFIHKIGNLGYILLHFLTLYLNFQLSVFFDIMNF
ncbi:uncharacterized protein Dwil_GK19033 [Drosophila willistoni]|uniref:N-alpha-acetyltransferase 20 n=1 Tax=Drosophila willistoni TaxID=7260 RepID=B4MWI8_DROWI|nr:uncharacterized protein Dwil_GK19033 [Drosophila willistoni]